MIDRMGHGCLSRLTCHVLAAISPRLLRGAVRSLLDATTLREIRCGAGQCTSFLCASNASGAEGGVQKRAAPLALSL